VERKQTFILLGLAAVIAVGVSAAIIVGSVSNKDSATGLRGLQTNLAPWKPEYTYLQERLTTLAIPRPGRETYHVHAKLEVYVDGQKTPVPNNIGVSGATVAALHTHDAEGIVHMEADNPFEVKLATFFEVWGVKFTDTQLGGYQNEGDKTIQVFVNGQKVEKPASYVVKAKDKVVVGYGTAGSFPTTIPSDFPAGL